MPRGGRQRGGRHAPRRRSDQADVPEDTSDFCAMNRMGCDEAANDASDGGEPEENDSTPSSGETSPIPCFVGMWDLRQCDPNKCTGRRLARMGLLNELKMGKRFRGVALAPFGTEVKKLGRE